MTDRICNVLAANSSQQVGAVADNRVFRSAILNPGSTASTLIIYDNNAASGTVLAKLVAPANGYSVITPEVVISATKGLYASIAGTAADFVIYYE